MIIAPNFFNLKACIEFRLANFIDHPMIIIHDELQSKNLTK
jgi:hypothetical protein